MFEGSDYVVEHYIKPKRIGKALVNGERGDILGNFDDDDTKFQKKKPKTKIAIDSEENPFADNDDGEPNEDEQISESESDEENEVNDDEMPGSDSDDKQQEYESTSEVESEAEFVPEKHKQENISKKSVKETQKPIKNKKTETVKATDNGLLLKTDLTDNQIQALIRGASKKNRYVLYVTNLNYSTTRDRLKDFFEVAGSVKSVRIPKVRKNAFAFVEMSDIDGFKKALAMHNKTLDDYIIKIQVSEGGKKKSANKKNILKQKNRKLAEMRNEGKQFERSGKGYSKTIKREIKQQKMQIERRIARQQKRNALKQKK